LGFFYKDNYRYVFNFRFLTTYFSYNYIHFTIVAKVVYLQMTPSVRNMIFLLASAALTSLLLAPVACRAEAAAPAVDGLDQQQQQQHDVAVGSAWFGPAAGSTEQDSLNALGRQSKLVRNYQRDCEQQLRILKGIVQLKLCTVPVLEGIKPQKLCIVTIT
jgi:hypothetical protein